MQEIERNLRRLTQSPDDGMGGSRRGRETGAPRKRTCELASPGEFKITRRLVDGRLAETCGGKVRERAVSLVETNGEGLGTAKGQL